MTLLILNKIYNKIDIYVILSLYIKILFYTGKNWQSFRRADNLFSHYGYITGKRYEIQKEVGSIVVVVG